MKRFFTTGPFSFARSIRIFNSRAGLALAAVCLSILFTGLFAACPAKSFALGDKAKEFHAGLRVFGFWSEKNGRRMEVAVWYPARSRNAATVINDWLIYAGRDAQEVAGLYPVILLSHDMAGYRFSNNDLACHLARNGFIVIAPTHPGDAMDDTADTWSANNFYNRPRQLLLALEIAMAHPRLAAIADQSRIGVIGVGSGAVTAMQLAGARPDPALLAQYCSASAGKDVFCAPPAISGLAALPATLHALEEQRGDKTFTPALDAMRDFFMKSRQIHAVEQNKPNDIFVSLSAMPFFPELELALAPELAAAPPGVTQRKLLSIALVAPGGAMYFTPEALAEITVPVATIIAGRDEVYAPALHGEALLKALPQDFNKPEQVLRLKNSTHYALNAPCPRELEVELPEICAPGQAGLRAGFADKRDAHLLHFFKTSLGEPLPQPGPGH